MQAELLVWHSPAARMQLAVTAQQHGDADPGAAAHFDASTSQTTQVAVSLPDYFVQQFLQEWTSSEATV